MKTSFRGLAAIAHFEGIVLSRYRDAVGVWTIGVGHTAAAGEPDPASFKGEMTVAEAMALLKRDIAKYEAGVRRAVTVPLEQHEFDALVSFHYNTGAIGKASLVRHLNAGNKARAAAGLMAWTKAGGRKLTALVERRNVERRMFEDGEYPPATALLYPATPAGTVQWSKAKTVRLTEKPTDARAPLPAPSPIPTPETAPAAKSGGLWAALVSILAKLFGKDR